MAYSSLLPFLATIEQLLAKYDHPWQAEHVRSLIELHDTSEPTFVRILQDGGMWGGSGSVWEVGQLGEDTRAFRDAIIELAVEMERLDIGCEGSRFTSFVFRDWNEKGL